MASGWPGKGHGALLKNTPNACFHCRSGTKYAVFGGFRTQFVLATSSTPTFSTGCFLPRTPLNKDKEKGRSCSAPSSMRGAL